MLYKFVQSAIHHSRATQTRITHVRVEYGFTDSESTSTMRAALRHESVQFSVGWATLSMRMKSSSPLGDNQRTE